MSADAAQPTTSPASRSSARRECGASEFAVGAHDPVLLGGVRRERRRRVTRAEARGCDGRRTCHRSRDRHRGCDGIRHSTARGGHVPLPAADVRQCLAFSDGWPPRRASPARAAAGDVAPPRPNQVRPARIPHRQGNRYGHPSPFDLRFDDDLPLPRRRPPSSGYGDVRNSASIPFRRCPSPEEVARGSRSRPIGGVDAEHRPGRRSLQDPQRRGGRTRTWPRHRAGEQPP